MSLLTSILFVAAAIAAETSADPICTDLFKASCRNPSSPTKESTKVLEREMEGIIAEARDKGAQSIGAKSYMDLVVQRASAKGIAVFDPELANFLKGEMSGNEKLFKMVATCEEEAKAFATLPPMETSTAADLDAAIKGREEFHAKYKPIAIVHASRDIPGYFNRLAEKCQGWSPTNQNMSYGGRNPKLDEICPKIDSLRDQAADLYRNADGKDHAIRAARFVRENWLPTNMMGGYGFGGAMKQGSSGMGGGMSPSSQPSLDERWAKLFSIEFPNTICNEIGVSMRATLTELVNATRSDVQLSRSGVEHLVNRHYTEKRRAALTALFEESRADVARVVSQSIKDPARRARAVDGYAGLDLAWTSPPPATSYKVNERGVAVLDQFAAPSANAVMGGDLYSRVSDPNLNHFKTVNADYWPDFSVGVLNDKERVNFLPATLRMLDTNPEAIGRVMAHELAHRVGPRVSMANGIDTRADYRDVIACYKDPRSIRMPEDQQDEVIADTIAAEVLAQRLKRLPPERRSSTLINSMQIYCHYDAERGGALNCGASHPPSYFRIGAIVGANASVRKAVGCEDAHPKYRSCGFNTKWPDESEATPRAAPVTRDGSVK